MAELSLRERLQPALLDRLVDDERMLTIFELAVDKAQLARLEISERELADIIEAQGLTRLASEGTDSTPDLFYLRFSSPVGRMSPSQLKSFVLKPPGAPQGISLQAFCGIEARNVLNDALEPVSRRQLPSRRLREYVCRDIAMLLNSTSLDVSIDLSDLPHVKRSVLNYGMPPLAGRSHYSVDVRQMARTIEEVIRQFEPRLTQVRVTPDTGREHGDEHQLAFRIDAQLWGQPAPEKLVIRTRISVESGDVSVTDSGSR
jgi:type VI secretion system protein ImpF